MKQNSDKIIIEVETTTGMLIVHKRDDNFYDVEMDGVIRHPKSSAEDVMRALGHYIQGISYKANKANKLR